MEDLRRALHTRSEKPTGNSLYPSIFWQLIAPGPSVDHRHSSNIISEDGIYALVISINTKGKEITLLPGEVIYLL